MLFSRFKGDTTDFMSVVLQLQPNDPGHGLS
jgi:hypothetical protein